MKKRKSWLILLSIITLMLPINVFASEEVVRDYDPNELKENWVPILEDDPETIITQINELELYNIVSQKSDYELMNNGYSRSQINQIREFDMYEVLKERSLLDNETLKNYGYSSDEIEKLKSIFQTPSISTFHNGGTDWGGLFATLTLKTRLYRQGRSYIDVQWEWEWDKMPAYIYGIDVISFIWRGTAPNGYVINTQLNRNASFTVASKWSARENAYRELDLTYGIEDIYRIAETRFQLGSGNAENLNWAKRGRGLICLDAVNGAELYQVGLTVSYGHTYAGLAPNIGYSGFDVNYYYRTEKLAQIADTYGYR